MSLEVRCHAVVRVREDPVMVARVLERRASNCLPWSVVVCWGQPNRAIQTETKALANSSGGDVSQRESLRPTCVSVDGSEAVPEVGINSSGPTMSICT